MNKYRFAHVNAGSATLLVIFVTLCLAVFGVLSVASARADMKLTEKLVNTTQSYYEADSKAQGIIGEVDRRILEIHREISAGEHSQSEFAQLVQANLQTVQQIPLEVSDGETGLEIMYQVPRGTTGNLQVRLKIQPTALDKNRYVIEEYRIIPVEQQGYGEENLDLWDGTVPG